MGPDIKILKYIYKESPLTHYFLARIDRKYLGMDLYVLNIWSSFLIQQSLKTDI